MRPPATTSERLARMAYERLAANYLRARRPWPAGMAATVTVRGVLGGTRAELAAAFQLPVPGVDDLEEGRVHPALIPASYVEASPWLPWNEIVELALDEAATPVFQRDRSWPPATAAAWLTQHALLPDAAPSRHPAAGRAKPGPADRPGPVPPSEPAP